MTTVLEIINHGIFDMFNGDILSNESEIRCDGCQKFIPISDWKLIEISCDVCGYHPGIECPECNWFQDWISNNKLYVRNICQ